MSSFIDISGMEFGWLTALEVARHNGHAHCVDWLCRCRCGNEIVVSANKLRSGIVQSCGCKKSTRNGQSTSRLYSVWYNMIHRCYSEKNKDYDKYGGRGITVCPEWLISFDAFSEWSLAHGYDDSLTGYQNSLDRIDVDGPYSPENCRWVPMAVQVQNRRPMPSKYRVTYNGETHTIKEWAEITGLNAQCIYLRIIKHHWDVEKALTEPSHIPNHELVFTSSDGAKYTTTDLMDITGLSYDAIYSRMKKRGWSVDECLAGHRFNQEKATARE